MRQSFLKAETKKIHKGQYFLILIGRRRPYVLLVWTRHHYVSLLHSFMEKRWNKYLRTFSDVGMKTKKI